MTVDETEQLLYNAALAQAVTNGYQLGDGADLQFHDAAGHGARAIAAIADGAERRQKTGEAVRSFQRVVAAMIEFREEAYRGQPELLASDIIGENTLGLVRERLCPGLWPFC